MRWSQILIPLGIAITWLLAGIGLWHLAAEHLNKPESNPIALVGYSAALVALAGWMIQAWVSVRNSRKQHTMNVLLQTRLNPQFGEHASRISAAFPAGAPIPYTEISKSENEAVYTSVRWVLNYYEFIAAGISHGDLDEPLMMDCICTQMLLFCARVEDVIQHLREEDARGNPSKSKVRVLKSLRKMQIRWREKARPTPWKH